MLEKDKEEIEMLKRAKEEEEEKAMYSVSTSHFWCWNRFIQNAPINFIIVYIWLSMV